jgi:tetratricopeptide (TPR) repeat protein
MLKRYPNALAGFEKVISINEKWVEPAIVYKAKALKKLGRHDEAQVTLEKLSNVKSLSAGVATLVRSELIELEQIYTVEETALDLFKQGQYEAAENHLRTLDLENLSIEGRSLFALVLMKQNQYSEADVFIQNQLKILSLSPQQKKTFNVLLKRASQRDKTFSSKWLFVDLSYGTTNNVYYDGKSVTPTESPILKGTFGTGLHLNSQNKISQKLNYRYHWEKPTNAAELTTGTHSLQAAIQQEDSSQLYSGSVLFSSQSTNNQASSDKIGINLKSLTSFSQMDAGLDLDFFNTTAKQDSFRFLQGTSYSLKPSIGFWSQSIYGQVYLLAGSERIGNIEYSDGSLLPIAHDVTGMGLQILWRYSGKGFLSTGISSLQRKYKTAALPDSKNRSDNETNYFLKLNYTLYSNLNTYLMADQIQNKSSLGANDYWDKNYDVTIFSTGIIWDAF